MNLESGRLVFVQDAIEFYPSDHGCTDTPKGGLRALEGWESCQVASAGRSVVGLETGEDVR
eukprot:SAG11_NODE_12917_length_679_cov_1.153448_1_plen_60_part_01